MAYSVLFNPLVWKEDLKKIAIVDQNRIYKEIMKKLAISPLDYGRPLSGDLTNHFFLRIGQYRVVYEVKKQQVQVLVIKVGFRRDMEAYLQAVKRILKD
ncbi:MAG: hypothetical protein A2V81_03205 [Candidatus Abawacabacteria bacterium RBG_16_42_10]|uniref:Addiction module toxin RelE n=1 Tax=Candidatus Abawacabacteria bacterium RBG_16_42_10 TaxID=1817814 RepID=A0A1F4XK88_9BACT|nr:MAG: hypothetical protein A2V81_03205 [Candidatus Abawacabacteria bacterium RBG_16_42_10]